MDNKTKEDMAGCFTAFLFISLFVLSSFLSDHFDSEIPIQIFFFILAIFCLFGIFPKVKEFCQKVIKEENKKIVFIILGILILCVIYQLFFRYEYKIYEGSYNRGYVVKLDRLTGKATQEYAKKQ